jgi:hypothetical protein
MTDLDQFLHMLNKAEEEYFIYHDENSNNDLISIVVLSQNNVTIFFRFLTDDAGSNQSYIGTTVSKNYNSLADVVTEVTSE